MEFAVLGPLEVLHSGRPLSLGGARRRALLAILLIHADRAVSRDRLLDLMWGAAPPVNAGKIIQIYVSQLRKLLQPDEAPGQQRDQLLVTEPHGYSLRVNGNQLDSSRFELLLTEGRRALGEGRSAEASLRLREALSLWRGPALADFAFEGFAQAEIARLEELRITALEDRIHLDLGAGRHAHVIAELETLIGENPLRERFCALLMVALYRSGRQGEALQAYRHTRSVLVEDLGVDPGSELQQLEQAILAQDPALGAPALQADEVLSVRLTPNNLPPRLTPLVGRERDMQELELLIPGARLLTLTGTGGTGKTRLALELAREVSGLYAQGVWLVELADLSKVTTVSASVASVFGVREQPGRSLAESVLAELSDKQMLIVMDNCEHLIESCAETIDGLLRKCPRVDILATSRAPLGIMGETVRPVPPLPTPDPGDPSAWIRPEQHGAVQLFLERAGAGVPDFSPNDAEISAIAEICARLGGLPLAIELAAARMRVLSAQQIAVRLDDRFRLLTGGARSTPQRQRSLRATMSWSYDLLSEPERALFRRLCVFAGGYSLEASEAVCAEDGIATVEVLDLLNALVDQSLVGIAGRAREVRYALSETVRQYGRERLSEAGEETRACRRHAEWFVSLVEEAHDGLRGPEQALWLERLDLEHNNLRAALSWSLEHDPAMALQMAGQAWWFWLLRGHFGEGRRWLEEALAANEQALTVSRCLALGGAGVLAAEQGNISRAKELLEGSLSLARRLDYERGIMSALNNLGALAEYQGDYRRSAQLCEESIELGRAKGDDEIVASALSNLATAYQEQGHLQEAGDLLEESMALWQVQDNDWGFAEATLHLAIVERARREYSEAARLCELSQGLYRRLGDKEGIANCCVVLGTAAHLLGDRSGALGHFQEALDIHRRLGDKEGIARTMEGVAALTADLGEQHPAALLLGAAESLRISIGAPRPPSERIDHERKLTALGAKMSGEALAAALARGRRMTVQEGWNVATDVFARHREAQPPPEPPAPPPRC